MALSESSADKSSLDAHLGGDDGAPRDAKPKRREGLMPPPRRPSMRGDEQTMLANVLGMDIEDHKELLSNVQKTGNYFRGFEDAEIDYLASYMSFMTYKDGELIAANGEEATWCGVLLSGHIDARTSAGKTLGTLRKGHILGEMALFRGGLRMADLVGVGAGTVATLLFADLQAMYRESPKITHRLMVKFGQAAADKLIFPHAPPEPMADRGRTTFAVKHQVAAKALEARGLEKREAHELLKSLVVRDFAQGEVLLQRGKLLGFIGIVLNGFVADGGNDRGVGELVGEWCAQAHRHPPPPPHWRAHVRHARHVGACVVS